MCVYIYIYIYIHTIITYYNTRDTAKMIECPVKFASKCCLILYTNTSNQTHITYNQHTYTMVCLILCCLCEGVSLSQR